MILYFTGTGNSKAVAEMLGRFTGEHINNIMEISPDKLIFEGENLIFIFPIYSWGVSPLILSYIEHLSVEFIQRVSSKNIYVIFTCGDDTGRAPELFESSLKKCGLYATGIWSVQMPNNYVLLPGFDVDPKNIEERKLRDFPGRVDYIARKIKKGARERDYVSGSFPGFKTGVIYPLFKRWGITPSKWYATDDCIGCGKCENICPVRNISLNDHRPIWKKDCISCLGCYHICPKNAVQYGKLTQGKGQYFFPFKEA